MPSRLNIVLPVVLALGLTGTPAAAAPPAQPSAAAPTVVTLQFDDGNADQYAALAVLAAHGLHATFYVNSGNIGTSGHLTWTQLDSLAAAGNEIGGHTISHARLTQLQPSAARQEVCGDRLALFDHGFTPVSFAYPYGSHDDATEQIVAACGYNSARMVSGVDGRRTFAETIPPADAYATRMPPAVKSGTSLATVQGYVTGAETHGGGWIQILIHHVCNHCNTYSMTLADLTALIQWLAARAAAGTVVRTTAEVIGGAVQPSVQP
jgi:peptidoglycan/xylan/chitin deacetylase (PgdA/CDA1 family)